MRKIFFSLLVIGLTMFSSCKKQDCSIADAVQRGSKGKEVLSRYVVFEFDGVLYFAKHV